MQLRYMLVGYLLLLVARPMVLSAADVTTKIIDPLGRPISNAVVNICWFKSVSTNDVRRVDLAKLVSDRNGIVKGTYDEKSIPKGEDIWAEVSKDGYGGYGTTEWRREFVL